jgi:hypothetical protein
MVEARQLTGEQIVSAGRITGGDDVLERLASAQRRQYVVGEGAGRHLLPQQLVVALHLQRLLGGAVDDTAAADEARVPPADSRAGCREWG